MTRNTPGLFFIVTCSFACNALQTLPLKTNSDRFVLSSGPPNQQLPTILWDTPLEVDFINDDAVEEKVEVMRGIEDSNGNEEETTLTLQGKISVSSSRLPKDSAEDVSRFFRAPEHRNLLVTGGGERPCTEVDFTSELLSDWRSRCLELGSNQPDENDSVLSVITRGIEFPGLKVATSSLIGVKYVESETESPRYEFVLLSNEQTVSGLAPAVWIFNKLTGAGENGSGNNSKFKSLTIVTYEEDNGKIVFMTDGFLSIDITFPSFLLKILPGDKKKIEERGSKSIVKTLDRDVVQSMKAFEKAYSEQYN